MRARSKKAGKFIFKAGVVVALCLIGVQSLTAGQTIVLRNGLNGYEETEDTRLIGSTEAYKLTNWGGDTNSISVYGTSTGGNKQLSLIRFGGITNHIPRNTMITNATLRLCAWKAVVTDDVTAKYVYAWSMTEPWVEGTSVAAQEEGASCFSYRYFHAGAKVAADYWGNSSAVETGPVDGYDWRHANTRPRAQIIAAEVGVVYETNVWYEFDVTDVVREWAGGTLTNNGVYLFGSANWSYVYFRPSEYADELLRPQLVIEVESITNLAQAAFNCDTMDETYTMTDISGNGHDATYAAPPTPSLSSDNPFGPGYGRSAVLNGTSPEGSSSYEPVNAANPETINLTSPSGDDAYTLQCWIKCAVTNDTASGRFMRFNGVKAYLILNSMPDGGFQMMHYRYAWNNAVSPVGLTGVGEWHHVAAVFGRRDWSDSSNDYTRDPTVRLFVDGVEVASVPVTPDTSLNSTYSDFHFGGYFKGGIDDVSVLPYALYPNELGYYASLTPKQPLGTLIIIQ